MLMQRLAVVLALAHAAARPVGPRALPRKAVEQRKAGERRAGWTAKLKFLRDDWQQAVLKPRGGASSSVATPGLKAGHSPTGAATPGQQAGLAPRGGASSLTTLTHAALGAVFEAGALLGVVKAARALPPGASEVIAKLKILPSDTIKGLPAAEWFAWCIIIFGSSAVGSAVDGSLRAATNQILMPTRVAGEQGWYASLDKPRWEPPGFVFPVMWLLVSKPTQLLAVAKVCASVTSEGEEAAALPWVPQLAAYCLHLALGDAWNKVFFGQQKVAAGALMISVFYGALLASAYLFAQVDATAGLLMVPTCLWVTVAAALNWSIYFRLGGATSGDSD